MRLSVVINSIIFQEPKGKKVFSIDLMMDMLIVAIWKKGIDVTQAKLYCSSRRNSWKS